MAKHFSKKLKQQIFERDGNKCRLCDNEFPVSRLQVDHIKPQSLGGEASMENGIIACDTCNRLKSTFHGEGLIGKIKWAEEKVRFYKRIYKLQTGIEYDGR